MIKANIATERMRCADGCSKTKRDVTAGRVGDVRRCEHGRLWQWGARGGYMDIWSRLSWGIEPIKYRRAVRALRSGGAS